MSDNKVTVETEAFWVFIGFCTILFTNFDDSKYDLYDAIMIWLMK
jgi:hypothetical protein